jgi:glycosyltransferase involved in cell wall biosynthesis
MHHYFKTEIGNQHETIYYGELYGHGRHYGRHLNDILEGIDFKPDLIFTYCGKWLKWLKGMEDNTIPHVHMVGDYNPFFRYTEDRFIDKARPDLVLVPWSPTVELLKDKVSTEWHPFSVNTEVFTDSGQQRYVNVSAPMSLNDRFYANRREIARRVGLMTNTIVTEWVDNIYDRRYTKIYHENYVDLLSRSRIVVNSVKFARNLSDEMVFNSRWIEATACGALLLTEPSDDMALMGFEDGKNCVIFSDLDEMEEKIEYYLKNKVEHKAIALAGQELTRERHGCEQRVKELTQIWNRLDL